MTIDADTTRDLRIRLSVERHAQIRTIREIAASAIAAAGQVRDVRLDQLEHPQIAEPDIMLELVIELALGPLASGITSQIVKFGTNRLMISRLGKAIGFVKEANAAAAPVTKGLRNLAKAVTGVPDPVKERFSWREIYLELPKGIAEGILGIGKSSLKEGINKPATPDTANEAADRVLNIQDSPASAVEEAVLRHCALQENAIGVLFDSYEIDIADPDFTTDQAAALRTVLIDLAATPRTEGPAAVRLRLFFEACIWCLAFPSIATLQQEPVVEYNDEGARIPSYETTPFRQLTVTDKLATYWVRRLPHPEGDGLQTFVQYQYEPKEYGSSDRLPWRDKDGKAIASPLFVPTGAFTALANYFNEMTSTTNTLKKELAKSVPKVYASQPPPANDPMSRFRQRWPFPTPAPKP
jgi:hypothetical protein